MEQIELSKLPRPLSDFIKRVAGAQTKTVYLREQDDQVAVTSSTSGDHKAVFIFDLDTGVPVLSVDRGPVGPFGVQAWRELLAQQEASPFTVLPNQVLFTIETAQYRRFTSIYLHASKEKRAAYFDLGDYRSELTEAEKYALATMSFISSYRKQAVQRLITQGLDMDAAYNGLITKGLIKRSKSGALSLTPAGTARKSQGDVWGLTNRI